MRLEHFEALAPICPVCRDVAPSSLALTRIDERHSQSIVLQGLLECTNPSCRREFPIVDGIPLIIADLRAYLNESAADLLLRSDLSQTSESVIGDCCGSSSRFNTIRQQLSSYTWDHYGEFDPEEASNDPLPGSIYRLLRAGIELSGATLGTKPIIDIGCGVGGASFQLAAESQALVLGVDLHFPMLRLASGLTRSGSLSYSRRRVGMVYDRRQFEVPLQDPERVDFWACDASCLPFSAGTFGNAVSMNLIDCVRSPMDFLHSLAAALEVNGHALIATPYDWSDSVTAPESWLGGHSQRGPFNGASEPVVRELLDPNSPHAIPGLERVAEADHPWQVRLHDRSFVAYESHLVGIKRVDSPING